MYPDSISREHLRFCLLQTMKSSQIFGSAEDAKRCTMFYGRVLCKTLYPEGPQANFEPEFPRRHASFGPWQAECVRCVKSFLKQVRNFFSQFYNICWRRNKEENLKIVAASLKNHLRTLK